MAVAFVRRGDIQEYDVEEELRKYRQWAAHRSQQITNISWGGTIGNPASQVVDEYAARVRQDEGVVESLDCLQARVYQLMLL